MNILSKLLDKFFIKQWNIGIARCEIKNLFEEEFKKIKFKWYPVQKINELHADPFILKNTNGQYHILFEKLCKYMGHGKIYAKTLDENLEVISFKELLNFSNHLSYPSVFHEDSITYVIPESSEEGNLYMYEFDYEKIELKNKKILIENESLLDTTIMKHENKYWLFSTKRGPDSNKKLYIHYSENLKGPYKSHKLNPFKNNSFGCRPAGSIFKYLDNYYRPTQNCVEYYGKSIIINKIIRLNTEEFIEEEVFEIMPEHITKKIKGIHTINFHDGLIVIDSLKKIFSPIKQFDIFLNKKMNMK